MKKAYITNGFATWRGPKLISQGRGIKTGMVANFPTYVDLPTLLGKMDTYAVRYTAAESGGAEDRVLRDQAKDDLINEMHRAAYWVMYTCNGDRARLISSGFPVNKEGDVPSPAPSAAQGQKLKDGIAPGILEYSFKKVPGAINYIYEMTPDPITPNSVWSEELGHKVKKTYTGLESGKRYWCRVQAIGKDGQCVCSEPISRISQ